MKSQKPAMKAKTQPAKSAAPENKWRKIAAQVALKNKPKESESEGDDDDDDKIESEDEKPIQISKAKSVQIGQSKKVVPEWLESQESQKNVISKTSNSTAALKGKQPVPVKQNPSTKQLVPSKKVAALAQSKPVKKESSSSSEEDDQDDDDDDDDEDEDEDEDEDDDFDNEDDDNSVNDDFGGISSKGSKGKKTLMSDSESSEDEKEDDHEDEEDKPAKGSKAVKATVAKVSAKKKQQFEITSEDGSGDEDDDDHIRLTHGGEELDDDELDAQEYDDEEEEDNAIEEGDEGADEDMDEDDSSKLTPAELGERIKETSAALSDFKAYKKRTRSQVGRAQMVTRLSRDCAAYYGYIPELIDMFLTMFGPTEMVEFLEANEVPRPTCIRTNTLKTTRRELAKALTARGIGLEPVAEWTNIGLKIFESGIPIGATPEYLAGHYMIQSPSSLAPVIALDPRPGEKVLDMCAAPGGKASHIAQLMRNEGLLVASDHKLPRMDALVANLARLGVKIASCVHQDGRDYPKVMGGFDRILLDAPCSGLGVISHDPSVKQSRTLQDIAATANLQRELLLAAIDSCDYKSKTGGIIVYSTCSISVQENEQVVQFALEKRDVVLVECGFDFGKPGMTKWQGKLFHPSMKVCRRLYPHTHNMDGFFIAKLKKRSNAILEHGKPILKKKKDGESNGEVKEGSGAEEDEESSVSSDEEKRRKKQSEFAKAKAKKVMKKFGGQMPGQSPKKRPQNGSSQSQNGNGGAGSNKKQRMSNGGGKAFGNKQHKKSKGGK